MATPSLFFHARQERLNNMNKSQHVDPDYPFPITRGDYFQSATAANARIAANDMHLAQHFECFFCSALH